ncbi:MAG TPA: hypothetical protein VGH33_16860, partial [Isosphaeraceae bacterium]
MAFKDNRLGLRRPRGLRFEETVERERVVDLDRRRVPSGQSAQIIGRREVEIRNMPLRLRDHGLD